MLSVRDWLVSSAVLSLSACGSGEQELLDRFFTAVPVTRALSKLCPWRDSPGR